MCCRYYIDEDAPEFQKIIRQMNSSPLLARWQESAPIVTRGDSPDGRSAGHRPGPPGWKGCLSDEMGIYGTVSSH